MKDPKSKDILRDGDAAAVYDDDDIPPVELPKTKDKAPGNKESGGDVE